MAGSIEAVQKILQETIAPGIGDIRERLTRVEVEIKRLDDKIDNGLARLDQKVDSLRGEMASGVARLDDKVDSFRNEFRSETHRMDDKIDLALDIRERLAALEARIGH